MKPRISRDSKVYFDDILMSIRKVESYTKGLKYDDFTKNDLIKDGVIRNLEIVGEAVRTSKIF